MKQKKIICIFKLKRKRTDKNDFLLNQKIDLFDKIFFLSSQYNINGAIDKGKDSIDVILYHLNDIYIGRGIVYRFYWLAGVAHLLYYRTMFNQQNGQPISIDTTVCVCVFGVRRKKATHTTNKDKTKENQYYWTVQITTTTKKAPTCAHHYCEIQLCIWCFLYI